MSSKKIAIIGPESSGKTTLSLELASRLNAVHVPEFARQYLEERGPEYSFEDLLKIAEGQLLAEEEAEHQILASDTSKCIVMDTDLQVIRIWSEIVFQKCDSKILSAIARKSCDFYLLTYPDLPWMRDPFREDEDVRKRIRIFHHYQDSLLNQRVPFAIVRGEGKQRTDAAIQSLLDQFSDIRIIPD